MRRVLDIEIIRRSGFLAQNSGPSFVERSLCLQILPLCYMDVRAHLKKLASILINDDVLFGDVLLDFDSYFPKLRQNVLYLAMAESYRIPSTGRTFFDLTQQFGTPLKTHIVNLHVRIHDAENFSRKLEQDDSSDYSEGEQRNRVTRATSSHRRHLNLHPSQATTMSSHPESERLKTTPNHVQRGTKCNLFYTNSTDSNR